MRQATKKQREQMKKGCQDDKKRIKPERDFRSVWSADAQAHSSKLQRWVKGGEKREKKMRFEMNRSLAYH